MVNKSYQEMTPAERTAYRIEQNRAADQRIKETPKVIKTRVRGGRGSIERAALELVCMVEMINPSRTPEQLENFNMVIRRIKGCK